MATSSSTPGIRATMDPGKGGAEPAAGGWDFDGACVDTVKAGDDALWRGLDIRMKASMATFSLGVFQYQEKASGKGLKRGKVVKRFTGNFSYPSAALAMERALSECRERERSKSA